MSLLLCWSASAPGKLQHDSDCVGNGGFMNGGAFFFIVVFVLVQYCFHYCSSVMCLEIWNDNSSSTFFFFG